MGHSFAIYCTVERNLKQVDSLYSLLHHLTAKSRLLLPAFILLAVATA